ncbi:hypothetical protein BGZ65_012705, partial [Modicella reniformis]
MYLSATSEPRNVTNVSGRVAGGPRSSRSSGTGILAALRGDQQTNPTATGIGAGHTHRRPNTAPSSQHGTLKNEGANGDCSSAYSRQRELSYAYRIYMSTNVVEPPEYFENSVTGRLEEIRG